jgi:iron(III) transport system permease protein
VPRAVPGLLAGLAFLWVFLFFPPLTPLRTTIFSVWLAYSVVWLAYGMRLISSSLMQVSPELEEAARSVGASRGRDIAQHHAAAHPRGPLGSWLLVFMIFEREYSTAVYLLAPERKSSARNWYPSGRAGPSTSWPRSPSSTSSSSASVSRSRCASA